MLFTLLTTTTSGINLFEKFNLSSPGWGLVIAIFFFITVLLLGLTLKRNQMICLILSSHITLLLFYVFPITEGPVSKWEWFQGFTLPSFVKAPIFIIITFLLFFLFSRSIVMTSLATPKSIFKNLLLGTLWVGFFLSICLTFLIGPESKIDIGIVANNLFIGRFAQFAWLLLSLTGIALIRPFKKRYRPIIEEDEEEET